MNFHLFFALHIVAVIMHLSPMCWISKGVLFYSISQPAPIVDSLLPLLCHGASTAPPPLQKKYILNPKSLNGDITSSQPLAPRQFTIWLLFYEPQFYCFGLVGVRAALMTALYPRCPAPSRMWRLSQWKVYWAVQGLRGKKKIEAVGQRKIHDFRWLTMTCILPLHISVKCNECDLPTHRLAQQLIKEGVGEGLFEYTDR